MKITRPFGGEPGCYPEQSFACVTDSGRSSLKLILKGVLRDKKILLPDFICDSVIRVLRENGTAHAFYHVDGFLAIDRKSVEKQSFDALYIIDYFGVRTDPRPFITGNKMVIEDGVFLPYLERPADVPSWIGFNSLRKISHIADGSIVISSRKLDVSCLKKDEAPFSARKYEAQCLKSKIAGKGSSSEHRYLKLFAEAESLLERQKDIFSISHRSMSGLLGFYRIIDREYEIRRKHFRALDVYLKRYSIVAEPGYPSYYVLCVPCRDSLRKFLASKRIYLPVHWPRGLGPFHSLQNTILSIPLFSRYTVSDMKRIGKLIADFCKGDGGNERGPGR